MQGRIQDVAESYINWWAVAGVDLAFSATPVSLLQPPSPQTSDPVAPVRADSPSKIARIEPRKAVLPPLPDTLPAMLDWLASDAMLPGLLPGQPRIMPSGAANAPVMIVSDMPDIADLEAGSLLSGREGILLDAMLAAIGLSREQTFISALSFGRFPGGRIEPQLLDQLLMINRTLISLVQPQRLLLLGDKTSRALAGMDLNEARGWLRDVNHADGTTPGITTFHPRFLLQRPQYKRDAWSDLKRLSKGLERGA